MFNTEALANLFKGSDVVISAYAPPQDNNNILIDASKSLVDAAKKAKVRLIAIGGAGSLKVTEDLLLIDAPAFPKEYKNIAKAHLETLVGILNEVNDAKFIKKRFTIGY
ncbi:NAD(P)-dependent oxidoreductase [Flavivirga aquatica]|uniref:NAD(P)-dependent oxidoreductase n=1 Tax=Flavivirga aquatica TaxID=1849968 RepID=UPI003D7A1E47